MAGLVCLAVSLPLRSSGQGAARQPPPGPAAGAPALTLSQAVTAALASNPAARAAAQQLAQAQARLGQAQAQRRFQITFNTTVSGSNASVIQPPPSHETFGTLQNTLTVPLPVGRRGRYTVQQAGLQLSAAQAQYQSARLALAGQVTAAYYDLLRKQALQAVAQQTLDQAQLGLTAATGRQRAGDVAQLDVLQAQVPVANAQASLGRAANDVAVAQQTLNDVTGRPIDAPLTVAGITGPPPILSYTLAQARSLAVQRSADVRAADATVRADEAALEAARLYREPALSLQAIDIRSNDQTTFSRQDTLQASVTLPLSDGGLGREQVREAQAVLDQARAQAQTARKTALTVVSAAYLTAASTRAQSAAALAARDIAQVTYDKTVLGYRNGLFPLINVLTAQSALAQARITYVQALYDAASSESALEAAVSGGTAGNSATPGTAPGTGAAPGTGTAPGNGGMPGPNATGAGGTSPAGAGNPGTSPSGTSTTGPGAGGASNGGRGGP